MTEYTPTTEEVAEIYFQSGYKTTPEQFDRWLAEHDREIIGEYRSNLLKIHERLRNKPGYSVGNLLSFIINDSNPVDFDGECTYLNPTDGNCVENHEEFDRWLEQVEAEAWKEGYVAGFLQAMGGELDGSARGGVLPGLSTKGNEMSTLMHETEIVICDCGHTALAHHGLDARERPDAGCQTNTMRDDWCRCVKTCQMVMEEQ